MIPIADDLILHLDEHNCDRYVKTRQLAEDSEQYKNITNYFISNYKQHIETLTKMNDLSFIQLREVCAYIFWSYKSNITLTFPVSEEEVRICGAMQNSKIYYDSMGHPDLTYLGSFQFLQVLSEIMKAI